MQNGTKTNSQDLKDKNNTMKQPAKDSGMPSKKENTKDAMRTPDHHTKTFKQPEADRLTDL